MLLGFRGQSDFKEKCLSLEEKVMGESRIVTSSLSNTDSDLEELESFY